MDFTVQFARKTNFIEDISKGIFRLSGVIFLSFFSGTEFLRSVLFIIKIVSDLRTGSMFRSF